MEFRSRLEAASDGAQILIAGSSVSEIRVCGCGAGDGRWLWGMNVAAVSSFRWGRWKVGVVMVEGEEAWSSIVWKEGGAVVGRPVK